MTELFLCDVRRQKLSIVDLCEHFGFRHTRAKRANQNDFYLYLFFQSNCIRSAMRCSV